MGRPRKKPVDAQETELEATRLEEAVKRKRRALRALKKLEKEETADDLGDGIDNPEPARLPGMLKAESILAELNGEGTFEVLRLANGQQIKMGSYDLDAWPAAMESLVRRKGGGDYLVVFRNPDGTRAGGFTRTYDESEYKPAEAPVTAAPAVDSLRFFEMMQAAESRHSAQLEALRIESQRAQADDRRALLELMKAQSTSSPFKNIGDMAALFKTMQGEKQDPLERILELREVMDTLRGDVDREDRSPIMGFLDKIGDALGNMATAQTSRLKTIASNGALPPAPEPRAVSRLMEYAPSFITAIRAGVAPGLAAENVYKVAITPEERGSLAAIMADDWSCLYTVPELADFKPWIDTFKKRLDEFLRVGISAPAPAPVVTVPGSEESEDDESMGGDGEGEFIS